MKLTASDRAALIRLASSLPKGSEERRVLLGSLRTAEKWIQKSIKEPGRLHKHFGIPEDETIPVAKIKAEIAKIEKKDKPTKEDKSLMGALQLALRLKKMGGQYGPLDVAKWKAAPDNEKARMMSNQVTRAYDIMQMVRAMAQKMGHPAAGEINRLLRPMEKLQIDLAVG